MIGKLKLNLDIDIVSIHVKCTRYAVLMLKGI